MIYIGIYLAAINVLAMILFVRDKHLAMSHQWRIPEATLLLVAVLGGALGAWLGMRLWHHKTKHKKFKYGVPALLLIQLFAALLLGAAFYMLDYSLKPGGKAERDALSMNYLAEYPHAAEWVDSMQTCGELRDTFMAGENGLRLHALYANCEKARGTVVLVHGYTDNALRMMMLGQVYHDSLHYNILAPEHVRHGQSEGDAIQMGWLDRLNVERWIGVAERMWRGTPIYLHGISMGAATVMMCSGDSLPAAVKGIIEDCGYTSVWDEFASELQNQFGLPIHPLMDVTSWLCDLRYGWNFKEASALEQVRKSTLPMLFIHGGNDSFVPTEMVHPLYEAKEKGHKQIWIAPGSAHARSFMDHPEEYLHQMRSFIDAVEGSSERDF